MESLSDSFRTCNQACCSKYGYNCSNTFLGFSAVSAARLLRTRVNLPAGSIVFLAYEVSFFAMKALKRSILFFNFLTDAESLKLYTLNRIPVSGLTFTAIEAASFGNPALFKSYTSPLIPSVLRFDFMRVSPPRMSNSPMIPSALWKCLKIICRIY